MVVLQLPFGDIETALLRRVEVTEGDLQMLAAERAKKVKEYLIEKGKIAGERLFIIEAGGAAATNRAARVYLQLK